MMLKEKSSLISEIKASLMVDVATTREDRSSNLNMLKKRQVAVETEAEAVETIIEMIVSKAVEEEMVEKLVTLESNMALRILNMLKNRLLILALILLSKSQTQKWKRKLEKTLLHMSMNYRKNLTQFSHQISSKCSQICKTIMERSDQKSFIHF